MKWRSFPSDQLVISIVIQDVGETRALPDPELDLRSHQEMVKNRESAERARAEIDLSISPSSGN